MQNLLLRCEGDCSLAEEAPSITRNLQKKPEKTKRFRDKTSVFSNRRKENGIVTACAGGQGMGEGEWEASRFLCNPSLALHTSRVLYGLVIFYFCDQDKVQTLFPKSYETGNATNQVLRRCHTRRD
ncbi:hypothetical protein E2C01_090834 [Portunus trituberculatus]|uniref:Uncharacterized protein n=1 Tax=Portunus trituberculatus TaxID=210409 RepID=A0A5B7JMU8_PORTR|nr:hypothetical protein [Portunus trituberculatus]